MKTLYIIFYAIGAILLISSCFTSTASLSWWLGGGAVVSLVSGCIFQFKASSATSARHH